MVNRRLRQQIAGLISLLLVGCSSNLPASQPTRAIMPTITPNIPPVTETSTFSGTVKQPVSDLIRRDSPPPVNTGSSSAIAGITGLKVITGRGMPTGQALARLGMGEIRVHRLSPDEQWWAIGTTVGIYVYNTETMSIKWSRPTNAPVEDIIWSPEGWLVAIRQFGESDILIWDAQAGVLIQRLTNSAAVASLDWSPDGKRIAAGLEPDKFAIAIWDVATGRQQQFIDLNNFDLKDYPPTNVIDDTLERGNDDVIETIPPPVRDVEWLPGSVGLLATVGDLKFGFFNTLTGELEQLFYQPYSPQGLIRHLSINSKGTRVISYSENTLPGGDQRAYVWDVASGDLLYTLEHQWNAVADVVWSPNGKLILSYAPARDPFPAELRFWQADDGTLLDAVLDPSYHPGILHWSAGWQRFITADPQGQLVMWGTNPVETTEYGFDFPQLEQFVDRIFISSSAQGGWFIWQANTGQPGHVLVMPTGSGPLAWSPGGSKLAILPFMTYGAMTTSDDPVPVTVWDMTTFTPDLSMTTLDDLTGWQFTDQPWTCDDEPEIRVEHGNLVAIIRVSLEPVLNYDKTRVSDRYESAVTVYNRASGQTVKWVEEGSVCQAAFSPNGQRLALGHRPPAEEGMPSVTGVDEGVVSIRRVTDGFLEQRLTGHTGAVFALAWSPDGSLLATSSKDGTTLIWPMGE